MLPTHPKTYLLCNLDSNENIQGGFYAEELTRARDPGWYNVKILKERIHKGKRQFLCEFEHYKKKNQILF